MIASLPLYHRVAGRPVIVLGEGTVAEARRRLVERAGGEVIANAEEGIARGARLAFLAHDDAELAAADAARLRDAGVLVNAADRPVLCDFTVPSLLDRAPVLIAIGTGGASAGLAKALRLRLEALLPGSLGALAEALHAARARLRARWPDAGDRRHALDRALGPGGALDPLRDASSSAIDAWLADHSAQVMPAMVEICLRSADADDLTLREARLLGGAEVIAHEASVPTAILDRARADASRMPIASGERVDAGAGATVVLRYDSEPSPG